MVTIDPVNVKSQPNRVVSSRFEGYLEIRDITCLIVNKMIGTGIFITPATIVVLAGSKYAALLLWCFGSIYSFISILIYLEYGLAWPFTGGEYAYISKIFPRPALIFATSFAWFFVTFSTSTGNALNFAKFVCLAAADFSVENETKVISEWLLKFIACWVVVGVCLIHYRLINIGVTANLFLAVYKVTFVLVLIVASWVGLGFEMKSGGIRGRSDWTRSTQPGKTTERDSSVNIALAMFLVLYSYQGWENANYVTAEIRGNAIEKKRKLKIGALLAIGIVSALYILFNLFFLFLLSNEEIQKAYAQGYSVAYNIALQSFKDGDTTTDAQYKIMTRKGVFTCIALSALGNLVGVIFTNGRVKREIAKGRLIPGSDFFSASSTYGLREDPAGTPTGGLVLHGLVTCITIVATTLYEDGSTEGLSFIINLFTYGHSVLGIALGIGLFFLRKRMQDNNTDIGDDEAGGLLQSIPPTPRWEYKILKSHNLRYSFAILFILINAFLVLLPCIPSNLPSGKPRRIPNWELPAIVLPFFAAGALSGFVICIIANFMEFESGTDREDNRLDLVAIPYAARRWMIQFPRVREFKKIWKARGGRKDIWAEAKRRLMEESEASHAIQIRIVEWRIFEMNPLRQRGHALVNGNLHPGNTV